MYRTISMVFLILLSSCRTCPADQRYQITEAQATACILGESRGEYVKHGYNAFLAIAEVIRHRGSIQGIYGCSATFSGELPYIQRKGLDKEALRAWRASLHTNITSGAKWFESTDFPLPYWAKDKKITLKLGKHIFYK